MHHTYNYHVAADLAGKSAEENAEIYSIVDCVEDLWNHIATLFRVPDEARKVFPTSI